MSDHATEAQETEAQNSESRRGFLMKAAYFTPALLTLPTSLAVAQVGSHQGSSGDPDGDPGDPGDPNSDPGDPNDYLNCDQPRMPSDSDDAVSMCELRFDENTGQIWYRDIIVDRNSVQDRLGQGDLLGTCDSFLCNAS